MWTWVWKSSNQTRTKEDVGATDFPFSVMIVFVGHIVEIWVHADGQHQLLLHLRVRLIYHSLKQWHNDLLLFEKSAGDVTSAFLKSWEILNFEALRWSTLGKKDPGRCTFSPCGRLLLQMLSPHCEQLKKRCWFSEKNAMQTRAMVDIATERP